MKSNFLKKYALLLAGLFLLNACNLLDQDSPNDILAEDVFTTPTGAENALIGLYSTLQNRDYYGGSYVLFPDAYARIATTGGYDISSLDEFGAGVLSSQNLYCEATYIAIYRTIANANRLLEGLENIPDADFEAGRKTRIAAEARFVRALAHFDLLRWFGHYWDAAASNANGIPLVETTVKVDGEIIQRSHVWKVYSFIISELEAILDAFPTDEERNANFTNRSAVEALLARAAIFSGNVEKAETMATAVIEHPDYGFAADPAEVYQPRGSKESIFEVAFDVRNPSAFNSMTYLKDEALRPELWFLAAEDLKTFFENRSGDARAHLLDFENNDVTIQPDGRSQKYRGESQRDNPAYVLRLAEQYLIRAEARFLKNDPTAWDDLNALRTARGLASLDPTDPTNADEFYQNLLDEAKAEFNFEGLYLNYLVRTGKFGGVLGLEDFRRAFPIPNREIAATGGAMFQNPGY